MSQEEEVLLVIRQVYRLFATKIFHDVLEHSIVAGGCVRDILNNKPVKDIDIFFYGEGIERMKQKQVLADLRGLFGAADVIDKSSAKEYGENGNLVYELKGFKYPVDIIINREAKTKEDIINSFDIGLCKVYFDPKNNKIVEHKDYIKDVKHKSLTCDDVYSQHVTKVCKKYSDFHVVQKTGLPGYGINPCKPIISSAPRHSASISMPFASVPFAGGL